MRGLGTKFLKRSFDILAGQTFKNFDVVVSDHSENDEIKNLCGSYGKILDVKYFRNAESRGSSSANINNAIKNAGGMLVKILFQDDFLYKNDSLEEIVKNFDLKRDRWLLTGCIHTKDAINFFRPFCPRYDDETILFKNTVSSPSVLTIKNENPILFDENLIWFMDVDYYKRCYQKFGGPKILKEINVVNMMGPHQVTNVLATENTKEKEWNYIVDKYNIEHPRWLKAKYKINKYKRILKGKIKAGSKTKTWKH